MFRATILPIIGSIRLYNTVCGMDHPMSGGLVMEEIRYQTTGRQLIG